MPVTVGSIAFPLAVGDQVGKVIDLLRDTIDLVHHAKVHGATLNAVA